MERRITFINKEGKKKTLDITISSNKRKDIKKFLINHCRVKKILKVEKIILCKYCKGAGDTWGLDKGWK